LVLGESDGCLIFAIKNLLLLVEVLPFIMHNSLKPRPRPDFDGGKHLNELANAFFFAYQLEFVLFPTPKKLRNEAKPLFYFYSALFHLGNLSFRLQENSFFVY